MKKRRSNWGKGWDGKSRIPDKTYRENFDQIDWSSVKTKEEKKDGCGNKRKMILKNEVE
jgi:hypothetical protein